VTITREVSAKTLPIPDTPSISSFEFEEGAAEGAQSLETPAAEEIEPLLREQGLSIDDLFSDLDVDETIVKPGGGPRESTSHEVPIAAARPESQGRQAVVVEPVKDVPAESTPEAPVRVAAGEPRRSEREAYRELFSLFLKGARVDDASFLGNEDIGEMMENLGAIFREMADGLWTILRGRTETKAEVRVAVTVVRPDGNNPLKMSPGADDVLRHLLKRQHRGFLEPVDAVREGIEDIINHQLAMNAGIKASLIEALDRFDPRHFEEKSTQWLASQRKIRCWNEYAEAYGRLKEEAFEGFFGKAFVRAYEEQLDKLRSKLKKR
jgi:type VI secretion system protein